MQWVSVPLEQSMDYHIDAKFTDEEGSGKRVERRPCVVTFTRAK